MLGIDWEHLLVIGSYEVMGAILGYASKKFSCVEYF